MANFGMVELLVVLGIALLLFGNRLPGVGKSLGEGIRSFRKGLGGEEEQASTQPSASTQQPPSGKSIAQSKEHASTGAANKNAVIDVDDHSPR